VLVLDVDEVDRLQNEAEGDAPDLWSLVRALCAPENMPQKRNNAFWTLPQNREQHGRNKMKNLTTSSCACVVTLRSGMLLFSESPERLRTFSCFPFEAATEKSRM
jgi:hypothetical protein